MAYFTDTGGYVRVSDGRDVARVHQLLAIADGFDPEDVFSDNTVIHHKNEIKWDNRVENIEMMTNSEHTKYHAVNRDYENYYDHTTHEWWDEDTLSELYHDEQMTQSEIADELNVSQSTIRDRFNEFDISTRRRGKRRVEIPVSRMEEYISDSSLTQSDLADEFDTTTYTVRKRLSEAGY